MNNQNNIRANKAANKKKTKKKKKTTKKAIENNGSKSESEEESEEDDSFEEDSPKKKPSFSSRTARVGLKTPNFADLNEQLGNLRDDEKKEFASIVFAAYRAKSTKESDILW